MNRTTLLLGALAASIALGACTDADTTEDAAGGTLPSETAVPAAADGTLQITGVDYGFEGFPETVEVGTELTFRNSSDTEFHEMAVMRLADDEDRSVEELLALPPEEAMASMTFVGVAVAPPAQAGEVVDGDLTLDEPGRYVATCFIPVGADPEVVAAAMEGAEDGPPPEMGDGAPHAMEGMVAEFVVE